MKKLPVILGVLLALIIGIVVGIYISRNANFSNLKNGDLIIGVTDQKNPEQHTEGLQDQTKNDNYIDIFSRQEKCHNHIKEAESRYEKSYSYVNVYYSPVLNTCIIDLYGRWDVDGTQRFDLRDFYTDKSLFSCTIYPDGSNKNDGFTYDEESFDEFTIKIFDQLGDRKGECNILLDYASEYLHG